MNQPKRYQTRAMAIVIFLLAIAGLCACSSNTTQGAVQGGASGAVAGAVGGMMSALIFGGDVAEAGARGAVYGGSVGAVSGGIAGSQRDRQEANDEQRRQEMEIRNFRNEVGEDAFDGVIALAECKHDVAYAYAAEARRSRNRDFSLAGLWLEVLTATDQMDLDRARSHYPELVELDPDVRDLQNANVLTDETISELGKIRVENGLPERCRG